MKILISIAAIIILGTAIQLFCPWWMLIPIVAIITGYTKLKPWQGFLAGLVGIAITWAVYAFMLNSGNEGILAERMGRLFGGLSPMLLMLTTALVGGIVGGLAGLTGSYGAKLGGESV